MQSQKRTLYVVQKFKLIFLSKLNLIIALITKQNYPFLNNDLIITWPTVRPIWLEAKFTLTFVKSCLIKCMNAHRVKCKFKYENNAFKWMHRQVQLVGQSEWVNSWLDKQGHKMRVLDDFAADWKPFKMSLPHSTAMKCPWL